MFSDDKRSEALVEHFPLFPHEDFDFVISEGRWPVGLSSKYSNEYCRRIAAGAVSYTMTLSSVDYTLKRYVKNIRYPTNGNERLDHRVTDHIRLVFKKSEEFLGLPAGREEPPIGTVMCDITFLRVAGAMKGFLTLANRGLLFESSAVARAMLEQIGWAIACRGISDDNVVKSTSASRSISSMKQFYPTAGNLYGWLSDYVHWGYEAHITVLGVKDGRLASVHASTLFKARALLLGLILGDCYTTALSFGYAREMPMDFFNGFAEKSYDLANEILDVVSDDVVCSEIRSFLKKDK